jgi:protein-L-isoaspartate(D-aspartate) O-methyltransferase
MTDFVIARRNMVECQIRTNKVTDQRLIDALAEIPRERFVPKAYRGVAYIDEDVPLGGKRFLMEPMVLARLIQSARVRASDSVLDVGCATGYATAILGRLAAGVVGLERDGAMVAQANQLLTELGIDNAAAIEGSLEAGHPKQAPYDVIVLGGAVDHVPESLTAQLAEGGRLVGVVIDAGGVGRATLVSRIGGVLAQRQVFDAGTHRLPGFERVAGFVF